MHPRKLLLYTHSLAGGGAERVWVLLASALAQSGHDVTLAVDFEMPENRGFLHQDVRYIVLPKGHLKATIALAGLLAREKPDVTFSAIGVSNLKHMLAALAVLRHRRAVISFHGFFASEPQTLSRLGNELTPLFTRLCGRAVAVSDGLRAAVIDTHHGSPQRVVRIYNPVDFLGAPEGLDAATLARRAPTILYVGRMAPDKDLATLLKAFARVAYPGATLSLVGDGPERPAFEAMARDLGIADRCIFHGYQANPGAKFLEARCLALSSVRESFGNVVGEALAHGLPVVSTQCAGPSEILDHGTYGAVVPLGDFEALGAAMQAALEHPGDPAPRQARAKLFAIEAATDQYEAMIEEIIAENT